MTDIAIDAFAEVEEVQRLSPFFYGAPLPSGI